MKFFFGVPNLPFLQPTFLLISLLYYCRPILHWEETVPIKLTHRNDDNDDDDDNGNTYYLFSANH